MNYTFQSLHRNHDLSNKVMFRVYSYNTSDEKLAAFVRRNCKHQPHLFWETTPEVLAGAEPEVQAEAKRRGRPPGTVNRGMRTSELAEGVSV